MALSICCQFTFHVDLDCCSISIFIFQLYTKHQSFLWSHLYQNIGLWICKQKHCYKKMHAYSLQFFLFFPSFKHIGSFCLMLTIFLPILTSSYKSFTSSTGKQSKIINNVSQSISVLKIFCLFLCLFRLPGCLVTEVGSSHLASALDANPSHLTELDLSYNHLGDHGSKGMFQRQTDEKYALTKLE